MPKSSMYMAINRSMLLLGNYQGIEGSTAVRKLCKRRMVLAKLSDSNTVLFYLLIYYNLKVAWLCHSVLKAVSEKPGDQNY